MNTTSEGTIAFHADNLPSKELYKSPYDTVSMVAEFEAACKATLYPLGTVPPVEKLKLRLSLELEELYEKAEAMGLEGTFCRMLFDKSTILEETEDGLVTEYKGKDTNIYDPVALLDACCDQRYVQDGTVLTCGLQEAFYEGFAEVQRSNLSKFPQQVEEAEATVASYKSRGVDAIWSVNEEVDANFNLVVRRKADGKILKANGYMPADLAPIIQKYTS